MSALPVAWSAPSSGDLLGALAMMLVFLGVLFAGSLVVPGRSIVGPKLEGGPRTYKLNGLNLFLIVAVTSRRWARLPSIVETLAAQ